MTSYLALLQLKEEILHAIECEQKIIESAKEAVKQLRSEGAPQENILAEQYIIRDSKTVISVLSHFLRRIDEMLKDV